jgi:hypothetical protein
MKFLGVLAVIFAVILIVPQSRASFNEVWGRFLAGGNLSAVVMTLVVVFVLGVLVASQDRA